MTSAIATAKATTRTAGQYPTLPDRPLHRRATSSPTIRAARYDFGFEKRKDRRIACTSTRWAGGGRRVLKTWTL